MSTQKDAVDHPYDWIDPQEEYWATHKSRKLIDPQTYPWVYDNHAKAPDGYSRQEFADMLKAELEPGDLYMSKDDYNAMTWKAVAENSDRISNPWANGRHAWAAIVWGLILMLTFSVGVGS